MGRLDPLHDALAAIQRALAEDALERLPPLVERYHLRLHAWMAAGIHQAADAIEPLQQLRARHHAVIAGLQRRQQRLRVQMQAERHGSRAARAYLSLSGHA